MTQGKGIWLQFVRKRDLELRIGIVRTKSRFRIVLRAHASKLLGTWDFYTMSNFWVKINR